MLSLPEWLGIKSKECLGRSIILKFDEDGALEQLLVGAAKAYRVGGTVWSEESFNVKLRAGLLITETLCVNGARL